MKYLIVGLGNIGSEYDNTRHNIGFEVCDALLTKHEPNTKFKLDKKAMVAEFKFKGRVVIVIKPTTYMNLSGEAVKYWMLKEKISLENILVIHDDLSLPIDKLRLRPTGTNAGHNGLKSIEQHLGTTTYPRIKFGIGSDFAKGKQVEFVLGKWQNQEFGEVQKKMLLCMDIIESFVFRGITPTMNLFN